MCTFGIKKERWWWGYMIQTSKCAHGICVASRDAWQPYGKISNATKLHSGALWMLDLGYLHLPMKWYKFGFRVLEAKSLMKLQVCQDGVKIWFLGVAKCSGFVKTIEGNTNLMVQSEEMLEITQYYNPT